MAKDPLFRPDVKRMILMALAGNSWMKRAQIVNHVFQQLTAEGIDTTRKQTEASVRKCLDEMKEAGEILGGRGQGRFAHYRLPGEGGGPADLTLSRREEGAVNASSPTSATRADFDALRSAIRVIGDGRESLYVYFFEADKVSSKTKGFACWSCKVGFAKRDAAGRIREQGAKTARSAMPVWALEIKTDDARSLEKAIHRVLTYAGRETTGGGAEWFLTTPQMVEAIYLSLESIRQWPE